MAKPLTLHPAPPPLPANRDEWQKKIKSGKDLNDYVEDIHWLLIDSDAKYKELLSAVWNSDAVEGSLTADDYAAADIIREKAKVEGTPVKGKNWTTIARALGVVLRRYGEDRRTRRQLVAGEAVPDAGPDPEKVDDGE